IAAIAAAFGGAAGRFTLDQEKLAARGIAFLAIGKLSGKAAGIESGFAARELAGLARGFPGAGCVDTFADNFSRDGRMLVEILAEPFVDERFDQAFDVAIELAFGLPFELRLRKLYGNHGYQAFANVVAIDRYFVLLLLEHAGRIRVVVNRARKRGTKAGKMRTAVDSVDGVGKGKNIFGIAVVILQRDFYIHLLALAFHVNRRIVERLLAAIQVLDEFSDASGEAELSFFVGAFVLQRDFQAFIQEGQLAEALRKRVKAINGGGKNVGISMKCDFRSGLSGFAGGFQFGSGHALFVGLLPDFAVAPDFQIEPV